MNDNEPSPQHPIQSDDDKIVEFKTMLDEYVKEHGLKINHIKGWTDGKINWMALNDRKCCCLPNVRTCPCPEGLEEIKTEADHECLCSILTQG